MKIGDVISCYYNSNLNQDKMTFTLKIGPAEKDEGYPCVYVLRVEDVGNKLVECIGRNKAGVALLQINIVVIRAFRDKAMLGTAKEGR